MNDFFTALADAMKKRTRNIVIGTYGVFWLFYHWQVIYVTFFASEQRVFDKFGLLKNEYVNKYFLGINFTDPSFYLGYIVPAILTYIFIWVLPQKLFILGYKADQAHKIAKRIELLNNESEIEKHKKQLLKNTKETVEEEINLTEAEQKIDILDPTRGYQRDFELFIKKPGSRQVLSGISESIYEHMGNVSTYYDDSKNLNITYRLNREILAIAHSNGLVDYDKRADSIELTDKGRYFISRS
ncbi:MAG: hypothetical protein PHY41_07745 [Candidatus Cloacimonetes bacterium]|nr:hypothetical protein [Candidatus Cloacimonadota bacterium]